MSVVKLWSGRTRLLASDSNTTVDPSAEIAALELYPFASAPDVETLNRTVLPRRRSRTKMSCTRLLSFGTRFHASDWHVTSWPSPDSVTRPRPPFVCASFDVTLARVVTP